MIDYVNMTILDGSRDKSDPATNGYDENMRQLAKAVMAAQVDLCMTHTAVGPTPGVYELPAVSYSIRHISDGLSLDFIEGIVNFETLAKKQFKLVRLEHVILELKKDIPAIILENIMINLCSRKSMTTSRILKASQISFYVDHNNRPVLKFSMNPDAGQNDCRSFLEFLALMIQNSILLDNVILSDKQLFSLSLLYSI